MSARHLSFVDDIENFETYPWGIDVHEEIISELSLAKENLKAIKSGKS